MGKDPKMVREPALLVFARMIFQGADEGKGPLWQWAHTRGEQCAGQCGWGRGNDAAIDLT